MFELRLWKILWLLSGLMEKMDTVLFLRILGFLQMCISSSLVSETVIWLTARVFHQNDLYVVGGAQFTVEGVELVKQTTNWAILGW